MADSMIQNSISKKPAEQKTTAAKNRMPKPEEYAKLQVGATPYESKGHLVKTPIWKTPVVLVEDTFENIKNVKKCLKGEGNDHKLGQINDLGMQASGLALAGYLATKRALPVRKGMELVGFASFFASMALFPKLFINTPIKALYGFNVDQKCIDSQGRKNNVHRDPQYFASDLYSSEQLDHIGDKMGVDKDMENRQEFVKRKMTMISTQANTLWMLTAGFATPIMSALISSGIEKGLNEAQKQSKTAIINKNIKKLGDNLKNADTIANEKINKKELETLLEANKNKQIGNQFIEQLVKVMDKGNSLKIEEHLKKDLNLIVNHTEINNVAQFLNDITVEVNQPKGNKPFSIKFEKAEIEKALEDKNLNKKQTITADNITAIKKRLHNDLFVPRIQELTDDNLIQKLEDSFNRQIQSRLEKAPTTLNQNKIDNLKSAFEAIENFKIKNNILEEYVSHKIGEKEDSVMAREWNKASTGILKAMGFSDKQLQEMKKSPAKSTEIFTAKMAEIATDDVQYKKVLKKIAMLINGFEQSIIKGSGRKDEKGNLLTFSEEVNEMTGKLYDDFAGKARKSGLNNLADYLVGSEKGARNHLPNCAKKNSILFTENSIVGAKNSLYKVIQGFDIAKKLHANKIDKDVAPMVKHTLLNGSYGDHYVKLDIEVPEVYKKVITNLYNKDFDPATKEVLGLVGSENDKLLTRFEKQIEEVRHHLGNSYNRFKDASKLEFNQEYPGKKINKEGKFINNLGNIVEDADGATKFENIGDLRKQMMSGETLAKFAEKSSENIHNTKTWFKMFGKVAGIAVVAVTLAAPFFFGKIKPAEKKGKREVAHNG